MEWIGRTATLTAGLLLLAGCRPKEPEPLNMGPIALPVEEAAAEEGGSPTAGLVSEPEVEEIPSEPQEMPAEAQETPPEPAEETDEPIDEEAEPKDPIGATIGDGPIGAVAKALWTSVFGETEPPSEEESPPEEEPPSEETSPSEP